MVKFVPLTYHGRIHISILAFTLNPKGCFAAWSDDFQNVSQHELILENGQTHAGVLVPFLNSVMNNRKSKIIATTTGPGSFTSIRVQLATAIGFKMGYKATLFCPNALEVLSYAYPNHIPTLDSFRGDFFCLVNNQVNCLGKAELEVLNKPLCGDLGAQCSNMPEFLIKYYQQHQNPESLSRSVPFYVRTPEYKKRW